MTRVLLVVSSGRIGGAEMHVLWLAEALKEDPKFEVQVVCREGPLSERLDRAGIPWQAQNLGDGLDLLAPFRLAGVARGFDLIHGHMNRGALYATLAGKLVGIPVVATAHGMTRAIYYRGAHCIAVSHGVETYLAGQGLLGAEVIWNGLPPPEDPDPAALAELRRTREELLGPKQVDQRDILVLANFHPNKGQALALETLAALPESYRLILAGDGVLPGYEDLLAQIPNGAKRVLRLGILPSSALPFGLADLLLVPSKKEAFSLVAAEARMRGIPVVASDVPGLDEVVPKRGFGCRRVEGRRAQDWAEAIQDLFRDPEALAKELSLSKQEARQDFRIEASTEATRAFYGRVLASIST